MQKDNSLSDRFESFGAAPSESLWNNIEAELDGKAKRKPIFWLVFTRTASIVLVLGSVIYFLQDKDLASKSRQKNDLRKSQNNFITAPVQSSSKPISGSNKTTNSTTYKTTTYKLDGNSAIYGMSFKLQDTIKNTEFRNLAILPNYFTENENTFPNEAKISTELNFTDPLNKDSSVQIEYRAPVENKSNIIFNRTTLNNLEIGFSIGIAKGLKVENKVQNISIPYNSNEYSNGIGNLDLISSYWIPIIPFQMQFTVGKDFLEKIRVSSGIGFSVLSSKQISNITNKPILILRNNTIQIPLLMDFKIFNSDKWQLTGGTGISFGYNRFNINEIQSNRFTSSIQVQTAIEYKILQNWNVSFQPFWRYQLSDSYVGKSIFYQNSMFGMNLGLVRKF